MRRSLTPLALGFAALLVGACHGQNGPTTDMPPPMMYRGVAPHAQVAPNRSATSERSASCTAATEICPTPSAPSTAR